VSDNTELYRVEAEDGFTYYSYDPEVLPPETSDWVVGASLEQVKQE